MAVMRIVKNNNFSIVSNSIIRGQNVPKSGDKMSPNFGTKCPRKI